MRKGERDLLEVLKCELNYLEKGGYERGRTWRPNFILEDSPTCINHDCKTNPRPCTDCILISLVPPKRRSERFPCRYIPLDPSGETLDSLYRYCDQREVEETVGKWLRITIKRLEKERAASLPGENKQASPNGLVPRSAETAEEG